MWDVLGIPLDLQLSFHCGLSHLCAFSYIFLPHEGVLDVLEQLTWHKVPKVRQQDRAL